MSEVYIGQIKGLKHEDRALTAEEVKRLYDDPYKFARCAAESAHPELWDGLLSVTDFTRGVSVEVRNGQVVEDRSGYGNHGVVTSPEEE